MLTVEMIQSVFTISNRISKDERQRLNRVASLFTKGYLNYLRHIEEDKPFEALLTLKGRIKLFQDQPDFPSDLLDEILSDIIRDGEQHKVLLKEDPGLIERLAEISQETHTAPTPSAYPMRTGKNTQECALVVSGKAYSKSATTPAQYGSGSGAAEEKSCSITRYGTLADLIDTEIKQRERDYASVFSTPEFLALPESTKKLMSIYRLECRFLMKKIGLNYEHIRTCSEKKLRIFFNVTGVLGGLKDMNISIDAIICLDENKLAVLFSNVPVLYGLLDKISFRELEIIELERLQRLVTCKPYEIVRLLQEWSIPLKAKPSAAPSSEAQPIRKCLVDAEAEVRAVRACSSIRLPKLSDSEIAWVGVQSAKRMLEQASRDRIREQRLPFRHKAAPMPPTIASPELIRQAVEQSKGLYNAGALEGMEAHIVRSLMQPACIEAIREGLLRLDNFRSKSAPYIQCLTSPPCLDALQRGLLTSQDLLNFKGDAIRQLLELPCLLSLEEGLFTVTSLARLGSGGIREMTSAKCLQALRDRLFTADDFSGMTDHEISLRTHDVFLQALRERRMTIRQLVEMSDTELNRISRRGILPATSSSGPSI